MTDLDARKFLDVAGNDAALQRRINALRGRDALAQLAAIAREYDLHFTEAEYRQAVVDSVDGELSEEAILDTAREMGMAADESPS